MVFPRALGAFLVVCTVALAVPGGPASAGAGTLQPGDDLQPFGVLLTVNGQPSYGECTLSFVFDGVGPMAGRVFFATAAHCVGGLGQQLSSTGFPNFGTLVFKGSGGDVARDYALIEVKPAFHSAVSAEVLGHPGMPTGVASPANSRQGDLVLMSGWGIAFSQTQATREERVGYLVDHGPSVARLMGPVMQGDSGGPWMTANGGALGIVSQITVQPGTVTIGCCPPVYPGIAWMQGPTVEKLMADAAAAGFSLSLRTA